MKPIRVLLADDHSVMREGLVLLVNSEHDMRVVAQAADGREACERARAVKPDVAVLDLSMPGMSGLQVAQALQRDCPEIKVLALSMHEDESHLRELVKAKAAGYVLKRSAGQELLQAIRKVAGGGVYFDHALATRAVCDVLAGHVASGSRRNPSLTQKEETVLRLIAWGYTNKEVAAKLSLSPKTIEAYKFRFGRKLGLHGRAEIVRYALRRGWLKDKDGDLTVEANNS
jgi:DNA-binding NarL/FixJ family response regulator